MTPLNSVFLVDDDLSARRGLARLLRTAGHDVCEFASVFRQSVGVEGGWKVVQPILDAWSAEPPKDFPNYAAGSDVPAAAALLAGDGRRWRPV